MEVPRLLGRERPRAAGHPASRESGVVERNWLQLLAVDCNKWCGEASGKVPQKEEKGCLVRMNSDS